MSTKISLVFEDMQSTFLTLHLTTTLTVESNDESEKMCTGYLANSFMSITIFFLITRII